MKYVFKKILNALPSFGDDGDQSSEANEVHTHTHTLYTCTINSFVNGGKLYS